jgi:hypothetical protein
LLADRSLTSIEDEVADNKLYRLDGALRLLDPWPIKSLIKERNIVVNLSTVHNVVTHRSLYRPADCDPALSVIREGEDSVLKVNNQSIILARTRYQVDPTARYRMSFDVRSSGKKGVTLDAGLATYDREGKLLTEAPGEHRYGVAVNVPVSGDGKWKSLVGDFQGVGNENYKQLRPGTSYVSPVIIVNGTDGVTTEIRRIRLERIDD